MRDIKKLVKKKPCTLKEAVNGRQVYTVRDVENVCQGIAEFLLNLSQRKTVDPQPNDDQAKKGGGNE